MRRAAASVAVAACLTTACTSTSTTSPQGHVGPPVRTYQPRPGVAPPPVVHGHPAALRGHGELAVTSGGDLYLLGGAAGALKRITFPGVATMSAWSPDHRFLAVLTSPPPPKDDPTDEEPGGLFVMRADGSGMRRMLSSERAVADAVWSPTRDVLAVTSSVARHPLSRQRLDLVPPGGRRRSVLTSASIAGTAWAPDGSAIAVSAPRYLHHGPGRLRWHSRIVIVGTDGSTRVIYRRRGVVPDIAGWTPDGANVLFWPDPMGSGSIAADGLDLVAVAARGGQRSQDTGTGSLTHAAWIAYAADRQSIATVDGGDREIWGGHKHIDVCAPRGRCTPVAQPRNVVSLWPSWTPDGTHVVFARLPGGRLRPVPYTGPNIARWTRASRLYAVAPGRRPQRLRGVPRGATAPQYASDGTLLFASAHWIWVKPPAGRARRVLGPLSSLTTGLYYGYVPYHEVVAWSALRPASYAGTS